MRPLPGRRALANVLLALLSAAVLAGAYLVVTQDRSYSGDGSTVVAPSPGSTPAEIGSGRVRAVVFGDSIVAGANAGPGALTFSDVAAAELGWRVSLFGYPGTGYTTGGRYKGGRDYLQRITQLEGYEVDVVVLEGGINDSRAEPEVLRARVEAVLDQVAALVPRAKVVLMGPWQPSGTPEAAALRVRKVLKEVAVDRSVPFVDPIGERWVTGRYPSSGNAARVIAEDGFYPNAAGHRMFGQRLAADLRKLLPASLFTGP